MKFQELDNDVKEKVKLATAEFIDFLIEIGRINSGEAYIVGSYERGNATAESDIDVVIKADVNFNVPNQLEARQQKNIDLVKKYGIPISFALRLDKTFKSEMLVRGKVYGTIDLDVKKQKVISDGNP